MENIARSFKAAIVKSIYHHFSPYGVSGVTVIAESHIAIHTWPEKSFAAIDIFSCSEIEVGETIKFIVERFKPKESEIKEILRGRL
jgi:S-adenosylmethionine decarboxylase proenzyme